MFVPMPIPPPPVLPQHFYNKYEKLDPEQESLQFVASDGTYRPLEDILVACPAPHPTEPLPNPNPLTPYAAPLHSGTHLSIVSLSDKPARPIRTDSFGEAKSSTSDSSDPPIVASPTSDVHRITSTSTGGDLMSVMTGASSVFDNTSSLDGKRKKKTGTSANGTTSTFVSRAIIDQNLSTRLADHKRNQVFVFANISRSLSWLDMGSPALIKHEPLSKLMLSFATVVCHDTNLVTSTLRECDVVIGTTTGDICWYDPGTSRYLRFNKQRCINPSAVTCIKWLPGSENLFMASHADGALVIYDKEREDADFQTDAEETAMVLKSAHDMRTRTNPVSYLALSRQAINAFAFSPDNTHVAVVSDDGCLKILDYRNERVLDVYSSYYGGLTCVAWSPDGHYCVTGGKDDIVTIWSFVERRIVARCHGHCSFINGVAFDTYKCDDYTYRIGSISEDGKLCLWDFALSSIHKPSMKHKKNALTTAASGRPVMDVASVTQVKDGVAYHQVESRLCTAIMSPITVMRVDDQPPTHLVFLEDRIMVATSGKKFARIRSWTRPA